MQESVVIVDSQGELLYFNRQADNMFNISETYSSVAGTRDTLLTCFSPEITAFIRAGNVWQGEHSMKIKGQRRDFFIKIDPIIMENSLDGYIIISSEITELVESREKAEIANLAKIHFLANISHEIRTPMIGILGAVDLLEQNNTDVKLLNNISIIKKCGEQLLKIINEILDVSKIEIDLIALNPENIEIYDLIYNTIKRLEPWFKEKELTLELDLQSVLSIEAFIDPYKLRQIITNLLFNAIKFTNQGTIKLQAEIIDYQSNHQLVISFLDTGIGISPEYIPHIFDSFSQEDASASRHFGGAGLGLYVCRKLVELMGGNIEVVSELGKGSEFIVTLPLTLATKTAAEEIAVKTVSPDDAIQFIPRSVLVVEDNEITQKIVCEMLKNYGFEVFTAINGLECLCILQQRSFDVILLDMQMPLMDGYDTAQLIREDPSISHIPIIAMTAHAMSGDREKCIACGCTSYIAKPFKSQELVNEIKLHLGNNNAGSKNITLHNNLFINELIPEFINILTTMIEELELAIKKHDLKKIKSISHDIKGTAGMYGFNSISSTAALIEKAASENSITKIYCLDKRLHELFKEARKEVC